MVPPAPARAADEFVVRGRPVQVGGVQKVDAEVERPSDGRDGLRVVALAVELRHPHAAEADGRNFQPALSELPRLHLNPLLFTDRPTTVENERVITSSGLLIVNARRGRPRPPPPPAGI